MPDITPDVTDELWQVIETHLPPKPVNHNPKGGRPRADDRGCLRGIVYVLREGCRWQRIPCASLGCPSGSTCWRRFRDWAEAGIWPKVHTRLLDLLGEEGLVNLQYLVVDSASVRAQKGGRTPAPARSIAARKAVNGTC